jgi:hypothetical protein
MLGIYAIGGFALAFRLSAQMPLIAAGAAIFGIASGIACSALWKNQPWTAAALRGLIPAGVFFFSAFYAGLPVEQRPPELLRSVVLGGALWIAFILLMMYYARGQGRSRDQGRGGR